jgi:rubrerythrin
MSWSAYFERNSVARTVAAPCGDVHVPPALRAPLIRSLQRFQIGEQGDGTHLRQAAAATGDRDYERAIELFVKEEQRHARLLAGVLDRLEADLLRWHWSDVCFTLLRRLLGLRWEILVLRVAELIGRRYSQALAEHVPLPELRPIFGEIMRDEVGHIAFHTDFLESAFARQPLAVRLAVCAAWWLFFQVVCLVVIWDHGSLLRAIDVPLGRFKAACLGDGHALVSALIAQPGQTSWATTTVMTPTSMVRGVPTRTKSANW